MRTPLLPAALLVLAAVAARAEDPTAQAAAAASGAVAAQTGVQKQLAKDLVAKLRSEPLKVGQAGSPSFSKGVMANSADWLKKTKEIPRFINENGCAVKDGKFAAVLMTCPAAAAGASGCVDFSKIVDEAAKNTELVYVDMAKMKALTGNPKAMAFGVTKELKKELRNPADPAQPIALGMPGKNTIALRGDPADAAGQEAPKDGVFSVVLAHEFLHIVLRQVNNPALGGGARKTEADPAIANMHHRLTDGLNWKAVSWGQSDRPWTPQGPDKGCEKAGQAAP